MVSIEQRQRRCDKVNEFLLTVASCGRQFFRYGDAVSTFVVDPTGQIYFVDGHSKWTIPCYTRFWHYGSVRKFTGGGTLLNLCRMLSRYIKDGTVLSSQVLGPWPKVLCDGDLWGYDKDMEIVREKARGLGLLLAKPWPMPRIPKAGEQ